MDKCTCGNKTTQPNGLCDWCDYEQSQAPHEGHYSRLGGTWWCDTCDSPVCDLT